MVERANNEIITFKALSKMRYIKFIPLILLLSLMSCGDMFDNMKEYTGEVVYPARLDTIIGKIGFERVEIDLLKAGRIPSKNINLGKANRVLITYDDKEIIIDSLVSWVSIRDLKQSKLYRFNFYTLDEFDNKSVPQQIALIPYTAADVANLAVPNPRIMASPTSAVIDWPNGLNSVLFNYVSLNYKYTDKNGVKKEGKRGSDSRFVIGNLESGKQIQVDVEYNVVPKVNGVAILDTVKLSLPFTFNTLSSSSKFEPSESSILTQNGLSTFTSDAASKFTKLTYPVHANSLQDLFYFPNLKELDLTGGEIFKLLSTDYNRNGATSTIGGGPWLPFVRKAGNISASNSQTLKDLLESGSLTKVRYVPQSMGLDEMLAPYVKTGIVSLVTLPTEALIPPNFTLNGVIQDNAWKMDLVIPAVDAPAGVGLQNVVKVTLKAKNASFVLSLPKEYQFNLSEYKNLKFKVYSPSAASLSGTYAPYKRLWLRFMNNLWAFGSESTFGQEYWSPGTDKYTLADSELNKWTDVTVSLSDGVDKHNRVIVLNIGGEPSLTFAPSTDMVYYFSNFRFSK